MPFRFEARSATSAPVSPCRAVKAAELQDDDLAEALLRALRFGYFATPLMMDTEDAIRTQAETVAGLDVDRLMADLKSDEVEQAYQADRAETRNAGVTGRPMILQDKHADTDGADRYTAPSVLFERDGQRLVAGGWQSFAVYDAMVANLDARARASRDARARGPAAALPARPHDAGGGGRVHREPEGDRPRGDAAQARRPRRSREKRAASTSATTRSGSPSDRASADGVGDRLADGARPPHGDHDHDQGRRPSARPTRSARVAMAWARSCRAATASAACVSGPPAAANTVTRMPRPERAAELVRDVDEARGRAGVALGDARQARPR